MALIVEDGTGLSTAESYISVADASTYFSNIGDAGWAALASDAIREQSLRKATTYMVSRYRFLWDGTRFVLDQALDWPRGWTPIKDQPEQYGAGANYYASNIVPVEVKRACASLALRSASAELNADLTRGKLSVTIGQISTTYDPFSPQAKRYPEIDAMLRPYLKNSFGQTELVRV